MIRNLKYSKEQVSWTFKQEEIKLKLNDVIFASEDKENSYIYVDCGENYETKKVFIFDYSGSLLMNYDIENGYIKWKVDSFEKELHIPKLILVGYFPQKELLLVMYRGKHREVVAFDLDGDFLFEVAKPRGFEMMYFHEFTDHVSIVCDGGESQFDKFGRERFNFKLDLRTGNLTRKGLG